MAAPYENSPSTPVWSRKVMNDVRVSNWEFFGWFRSCLELSEYLEERLVEQGFRNSNDRFMVAGTSTYQNFQFLFVYDWKADQIGKSYAPYAL